MAFVVERIRQFSTEISARGIDKKVEVVSPFF